MNATVLEMAKAASDAEKQKRKNSTKNDKLKSQISKRNRELVRMNGEMNRQGQSESIPQEGRRKGGRDCHRSRKKKEAKA